MQAQFTAEFQNRTILKISWRLLPLIVVSYLIAYIDRTNVAIASLTMNKDLGISAYAYGWGAGIFFLGYALFEVPSNMVLTHVGARRWIARIMITWGIVSALMATVTGPVSFLVLRFLRLRRVLPRERLDFLRVQQRFLLVGQLALRRFTRPAASRPRRCEPRHSFAARRPSSPSCDCAAAALAAER